MDVDNLEFQQDIVASDSNSPLHLIREKEIEISGRMLVAKRQADEIVADARKRSAAIVSAAHDEGAELAKKQDEQIRAEVQREMAEVGTKAEKDAAALQEAIGQRMSEAVSYVLDTVMGG